MSKPETTIKPKPDVNAAALEAFISGNDNPVSAPAVAVVTDVQPASQQSSQLAGEATAMLSVRIPAGLHHKLRVHSVTVGRNIQDIVTELLGSYLDNPPAL